MHTTIQRAGLEQGIHSPVTISLIFSMLVESWLRRGLVGWVGSGAHLQNGGAAAAAVVAAAGRRHSEAEQAVENGSTCRLRLELGAGKDKQAGPVSPRTSSEAQDAATNLPALTGLTWA